MRRNPLVVVVLYLAVASACASSGVRKEEKFVAATKQTVLLETENGLGVAKARISYLRNNSTVPVVVSQVNVMDCQNVRQRCGISKLNVEVKPGQRQEFLRIEPDNRNAAYNYRMLYSWRPVGNTRGARAALAEAEDETSPRRRPAAEGANNGTLVDAKSGDRILLPTELRQLGRAFAALRADPDTVEMSIGSRLHIYEQLRVQAVDSTGQKLGRVRVPMTWTVTRSPGIRFLAPDTLQADSTGRVSVTIRINPGVLTDTAHARTIVPVTFTVIAK